MENREAITLGRSLHEAAKLQLLRADGMDEREAAGLILVFKIQAGIEILDGMPSEWQQLTDLSQIGRLIQRTHIAHLNIELGLKALILRATNDKYRLPNGNLTKPLRQHGIDNLYRKLRLHSRTEADKLEEVFTDTLEFYNLSGERPWKESLEKYFEWSATHEIYAKHLRYSTIEGHGVPRIPLMVHRQLMYALHILLGTPTWFGPGKSVTASGQVEQAIKGSLDLWEIRHWSDSTTIENDNGITCKEFYRALVEMQTHKESIRLPGLTEENTTEGESVHRIDSDLQRRLAGLYLHMGSWRRVIEYARNRGFDLRDKSLNEALKDAYMRLNDSEDGVIRYYFEQLDDVRGPSTPPPSVFRRKSRTGAVNPAYLMEAPNEDAFWLNQRQDGRWRIFPFVSYIPKATAKTAEDAISFANECYVKHYRESERKKSH